MDKQYKISIPEPCLQDWDNMSPKDNGRFCLSCTKTVVDFTSMLPDEVQHFFIQNQNNKICGRFKNTPLDEVTIQIPSRILYSQIHYHKIFLLALFVAMGTTLFSCADKDGNKKKIDKVEVIENESSKKNTTVGIILPPKNSSQHTLPPPPLKADQVKFVKPETKDKTVKKITDIKKAPKEEPYVTGAVMQSNAEFPGGVDRFYTFFGNEFKKPENTDTSNLKIRISFAIEKNGSVSYLESDPVIDKAIEKEIIRVLSLCPKWQPGESNGKKTRMQYSLPIVLQ